MTEEKTCNHPKCQVALKKLIITFDNGEKLVACCPNHAAENILFHSTPFGLLDSYPSELTSPIGTCDACKKQGKVVYSTMTYKDEIIHITLCQKDLIKLVNLNLTRNGFKKLKEKHGIFHEIHDDFYDEEGYALQPRV